jgi:hypothetical protein
VQLDAAINALFVYCNIIEPVMVGNTFAQLLRPVEISHSLPFGGRQVTPYQNPYYIPLLFNEISKIEIDIQDDNNLPIRFAFGQTILTLHFRKKVKNVFESLYQLLR